MASTQRKRIEGAMSKLAVSVNDSRNNPSHLSTLEINQPTKYIAVENIEKSPYQPRIKIDSTHIALLAESIRNSSLSNPIVVRVIGDEKYELIAGENRLEAIKLLGEQEILAVVRRVDDRTAWFLSVADNLARKDLSDYEQGVAFQKMLDSQAAGSIKELAEHVGVNRTHLHSCLAFSTFPAAAHEILRDNPTLIGARLALELKEFCLDDHHTIVLQAIEMIRDKKLSQGNAIAWINQKLLGSAPSSMSTSDKDAIWQSNSGKIKVTSKKTKMGITMQVHFDTVEISSESITLAIRHSLDSLEPSC